MIACKGAAKTKLIPREVHIINDKARLCFVWGGSSVIFPVGLVSFQIRVSTVNAHLESPGALKINTGSWDPTLEYLI